MNLIPMLAQASSDGAVHNMIVVLLVGICLALVWWAGNFFIGRLGVPAIVKTIWDGLFVLLCLIFVVNFLMGLAGRPLFRY